MDILHRVGIKASSERVYAALATIDGVAGWLTSAQGDYKVGGAIKLRFIKADGREFGSCDAKVLELRPAERVLWQVMDGPADWIGTKISVIPGPRTPSNLPSRNTTPRSYCRSIRMEARA